MYSDRPKFVQIETTSDMRSFQSVTMATYQQQYEILFTQYSIFEITFILISVFLIINKHRSRFFSLQHTIISNFFLTHFLGILNTPSQSHRGVKKKVEIFFFTFYTYLLSKFIT